MVRAIALLALLAPLAVSAFRFSGEGTAYSAPFDKDATGFNACQFGKLEARWEKMYAALNSAQYDAAGKDKYGASAECGRCARVRGIEAGASGKSFLVKIVDRCPTCSYGDLDFSTTALEAITGFNWDRKNIEWFWDSCDGADQLSAAASVPEPTTTTTTTTTAATGSTGTHPDAKPTGTYSSWVVSCEDGRARCPNRALASQGYQCMNRDETRCCIKPNGEDCVDKDSVADDQSLPWEGGRKLRKLLW